MLEKKQLHELAIITGSIDNVSAVEISVFENSNLLEPPYGDKYLGFVFSQANEKALVLNALKNAMNTSMPIIK